MELLQTELIGLTFAALIPPGFFVIAGSSVSPFVISYKKAAKS